MKRKYVSPVIQKITFDYKLQTAPTIPSSCFGSVINVSHGITTCDDGTPSYIGWNSEHPGQF